MLNLKEVLINLDHSFLTTNKLPVFNNKSLKINLRDRDLVKTNTFYKLRAFEKDFDLKWYNIVYLLHATASVYFIYSLFHIIFTYNNVIQCIIHSMPSLLLVSVTIFILRKKENKIHKNAKEKHIKNFNKNDIENLHNFTKWKTKYDDTEKYKDMGKARIGYFAEFFLEKLK